MKISDMQSLLGIRSYKKDANHRPSGDTGKKSGKTDEVHISQEAMRLLDLQGADRAKHIQDLQQQVSTGMYHVESAKIAEKLLPYLQK